MGCDVGEVFMSSYCGQGWYACPTRRNFVVAEYRHLCASERRCPPFMWECLVVGTIILLFVLQLYIWEVVYIYLYMCLGWARTICGTCTPVNFPAHEGMQLYGSV